MKEDRKEALLRLLRGANSWVTGSFLAHSLGVSERTVRSYISELSSDYKISSSKLGYKLSGSRAERGDERRQDAAADDTATRATRVLSRLLSASSSISLFDLADEMGIGESTLTNTVLPATRREAQTYGVELVNHNWQLSLEGSERAKRKLLGHVATSNSYGYFSSKQTLASMFPHIDTDRVMSRLVTICQDSGLFLNEYALNNLLIHVLIIIIRIKSGNTLDHVTPVAHARELTQRLPQKEQIETCAKKIADELKRTFDCTIPSRDFGQIVLLISLSTNPVSTAQLNQENIAAYVGQDFFADVRSIVESLERRYGLEPFDSSFVVQLALHSYNAYQRALFGAQCPNPIGSQIKQEYPLIYDMAVYYSHRLQSLYEVKLSEDEIAFIAFHIGAYIEKNGSPDGLIKTIVVVEQYHDFARQLTEAIERTFANDINLIGTYSYDEYLSSLYPCDLLITTIDTPTHHPHKVIVSPVIGKQGINRIRRAISQIETERKGERARSFLKDLIKPDLFVRNLVCSSPEEYIGSLGVLCKRAGYVDDAFIEDVKLRERVSSTAFTDILAIPHAISQSAERSFICALHNDAPIPWGNGKTVSIVLMIGLTPGDMKSFSQALNIIIDRFTDTEIAMRVVASDTYEEFVEALVGSR